MTVVLFALICLEPSVTFVLLPLTCLHPNFFFPGRAIVLEPSVTGDPSMLPNFLFCNYV